MRILVIGKNGQIASALQKVAKSNHVEIYAFAKDEIDIRQISNVEKKIKDIKPDAIINTAAYLILSDCEKNPDKAFALNTIAISELALLSEKYGIKFMTYSTDYVFDGKKNKPYLETDQANPLQMYGISKVAGETAARNYYSQGSYVIRTSGIFGGLEGSTIKKSNFVLGILKDAKNNDAIEVRSTSIMSPTYADDLATASIKLLTLNAQPDIYHLTNGSAVSWQDFAQLILKIGNISKPLIKSNKPIEEIFQRPKYSVLANANARKYGIVLPTLEDSLRTYIKQDLHV